MNVEAFLENFSHIASAPSGITRLREMVYELAVTGRLCEQRPDEGDGQSLLQQIELAKRALIDAGRFKRTPRFESLRGTFSDGIPEIPSTWACSRLVDVGEIGPRNEAGDTARASFVSMRSISEMHAVDITPEERPWGTIKKGYTHFASGDVVVAKITPCFENGKAAVIKNLPHGIGAGTTELHVIRPIPGMLDPWFIYVFLRSPYFRAVGERHMTGTAGQKRLPTEYFATRPLPLPPLSEQERIVAKVDELMALCDQLEERQRERQERFPVLSHACHARLAETPTLATLNRIFEAIGAVSPPDLRRSILRFAVQGRLVCPDPDDESVEVLLVHSDENRLAVAREDRRANASSLPIRSGEDRWEIPTTWAWRPLADLVLFIDYRGRTPAKTTSGVRLITAKNVRQGFISVTPEEFVSEETYSEWMTRGIAAKDDVLFTTEAPMGNAALIQLPERFALAQRVICFRGYGAVDPSFLVLQFLADPFQSILEKNGTGVTAKGIKASKLKQLPIAVPPLREQRRIVLTVDHLMSLVDTLEAQQQERNHLADIIAKAVVAALTGTRLEEREKMKAPKTELISVLKLGTKPKPKDDAPLAVLLHKAKGVLSAKSLWKQSGMTIDAFYQELKTELATGLIASPEEAVMKEVEES